MALVELPAEVARLEPSPPTGQIPAEVAAALADMKAEIARHTPHARCHHLRRRHRDSLVLLCTPEADRECTSPEHATALIQEIQQYIPAPRVRLDCPCVTETRHAS